MKKRFICFILAVSFMLLPSLSFADVHKDFVPSILSKAICPAEDWYNSDTSRTMFVFFGAMDIYEKLGESVFFIDSDSSSYVGYSSSLSTVIGILPGREDKLAVVFFTPDCEDDEMSFSVNILDHSNENAEIMAECLQKFVTSPFVSVSSSSIKAFAKEFVEMYENR